MKKFLILLFYIGISAESLMAQGGFTTVTGTITDPNGVKWSCGTISAQLITAGGAAPTLNGGGFTTQTSPVSLGCPTTPGSGANGSFAMRLADSGVISPSNTTWRFTVNTTGNAPPLGTGPQSFTFTTAINCSTNTPSTCTSNQLDISTQLSALAPALGGGGGITTVGSNTDPSFPSGLLAWYRCMPTDTIASLKDYSGNNFNATGTVGTAPTILTGGGGCNFTGNGAISLPAFSSPVKTVQAVIGYQQSSNSNIFNAVVTSTTNALILMLCSGSSCLSEFGTETNVAVLRGFGSGAGGDDFKSRSFINGIAVVTMTLRSVPNGGDFLYINKIRVCAAAQVVTAPVCTGSAVSANITTGNFQMGGGAAGVGGVGVQSYFTGQIYDLAFYSTDFDDNTQAAGYQALATDATNRGITLGLGATDTGYQWVADGDSQTAAGGGVTTHYPAIIVNSLNQAFGTINNGGLGTTAFVAARLYPFQVASNFRINSSGNLVTEYLGVNDCGALQTGAQILQSKSTYHSGIRQLAAAGGFNVKTISMDHLSNTGADACKNSANSLQRQHWTEYTNWFIDIGASALGADGASVNTTFFVDGLHPTQASQYNYISPMVQRAINGLFGNQNFTSATTYASVAPAAVTITAASESGNTMTFTSASGAPVVGKCVTVTGVTPAGYNSLADGCWYVITSNGTTSWTAFNNTTGLGAGTVFGTFQVPQQADADNFAILNFGAGNHTLQPCWQWGAGLNYTVKNINAAGSTIVPFGSETIDGAANLAIAANQTRILQSVLVSPAAAGCNWKVIQ
jgi:hypothetical protein